MKKRLRARRCKCRASRGLGGVDWCMRRSSGVRGLVRACLNWTPRAPNALGTNLSSSRDLRPSLGGAMPSAVAAAASDSAGVASEVSMTRAVAQASTRWDKAARTSMVASDASVPLDQRPRILSAATSSRQRQRNSYELAPRICGPPHRRGAVSGVDPGRIDDHGLPCLQVPQNAGVVTSGPVHHRPGGRMLSRIGARGATN
jgi:hypothetical protein